MEEMHKNCYQCEEPLDSPHIKVKEQNDGRYRNRLIHTHCEEDYKEEIKDNKYISVESKEVIDPPSFSDLEREECEIELDGSDMYVQYDEWEYYLGEANGPCHPSVRLDGYNTMLRFYDDKALIIHEIPEDDQTWEITYRVRNVYPIAEVEQ